MRVFHFRSVKYGLKSLEERRLKISRIHELNDPFEILGANLSNWDFRRVMNDTKREISKTNGLLCFSKNWQNPVQWSHYADNHRGVCLEFDVPDDHLEKVDYVKERLDYGNTIDLEIMKKYLKTKFEHWSYEEEYRAFISLDPAEEEDGKYFFNFGEELKLRTVIVGCLSAITRKQIADVLIGLEGNVEYFKARAGFTRFEVVRNQNDKLWT